MNGQGDKGTLTMNAAYYMYIYMYVCRQYAGPKSAKTNIALRVSSGRLHIGRLHVGRLHVGRLHVGRLSAENFGAFGGHLRTD